MVTKVDNALSKTLHNAVLSLLRPLVRILLRNGISHSTFAEISKKVYVDVAFQDFAEPGRKQTISRVSALTGLTRKETKRLHEIGDADDQGTGQRYNRAIRVISGWLNDPEFLDDKGNPLILPIEGETGSFCALAKKYSGDIPTQAMLAVLRDAHSVAIVEGQAQLIQNAYIPSDDPIDKIRILGTDVAELITTIDHNLTCTQEQLFFQRKVSNTQVKSGAIGTFRSLSAEKAQALLEELDHWLSQNEESETDRDKTGMCNYISLGIYYFEQQRSCNERTE